MKKINTVMIVLFVLTVVLEITNIFLSNKVTTESIAATQLRNDISIIDEQNQNIRSDILEYTSFETVASRAATLGFVDAKDSISLNTPMEVASSQ